MSERKIPIPKEGYHLTVSENAFYAHYSQMKKDVDDNKQLMQTVIVVLLIMVAGMLIDTWHFKTTTYQELINRVYGQSQIQCIP